MFEEKSRYSKLKSYEESDHRGRKVIVVPVPTAPEQQARGRHLMKQGQRLDHLAQQYLQDPAAFWRICEINGAMFPEQLTEHSEIIIPYKNQFK